VRVWSHGRADKESGSTKTRWQSSLAVVPLLFSVKFQDIPKENLGSSWYQVNQAVKLAYQDLMTCPYFIENYPAELSDLKVTKTFKVVIDNSEKEDVVAFVKKRQYPGTIFVSDLFLSKWDLWEKERIMAHEFLHLLGLPGHGEIDSLDPIQKTTRYCFPMGVMK